MSEINSIEAVARGICKGRNLNPDDCVHGGGDTSGRSYCTTRRWQWYAADARAAITALTENITVEMVLAALHASEDYFVGDAITAEGFEKGIRAMLNQAMKEQG